MFQNIKAVIFDLDGTLYYAPDLKKIMLFQLLRAYCRNPVRGFRVLRCLKIYRHAQEKIRLDITNAHSQIAVASQMAGVSEEQMQRYVSYWMEDRPLGYLKALVPSTLEDFLLSIQQLGLKMAVVSDYPARKKLEAMGIAHYFQAIVCAQDGDIGVFKPDPKGLLKAMEELGVSPRDTVYIGDRADVDEVAGKNAGIFYTDIIDPNRNGTDFAWLQTMFENHLGVEQNASPQAVTS